VGDGYYAARSFRPFGVGVTGMEQEGSLLGKSDAAIQCTGVVAVVVAVGMPPRFPIGRERTGGSIVVVVHRDQQLEPVVEG